MFQRSLSIALLACVSLGACQSSVYETLPTAEVTSRNMAPPGAAPGTCWGRDATPAVIETVTEQVMLQPAEIREDGSITEPAIYKTETQQKIVTPRQDTWFETPCDDMMTPEFNATVQRALQARGHYRGAINGRMDGRTRAAIRAYQKPQGLDSGMLSLAAARQMGLLQVDLEDAGIDVEMPDISVAVLDDNTDVAAPVAESASAAATRITEEQAEERIAREAQEAARAEEAAKLAEAEAAYRAEEEARAAEAARIAEAEAAAEAARKAEAARIAEAEAAAEAARKAEGARVAAAEREKNKRAKELAEALEEEKARTGNRTFEPLPISSESY